jgi:uncharacterized protein YgiM (DUF1202 family)
MRLKHLLALAGCIALIASFNRVIAQTAGSCEIDLIQNTHTCQNLKNLQVQELTGSGALLEINLAPNYEYDHVRFEIEYDAMPTGWLVNIGDSASNNGYAGDGATQSNDAEVQIVDTTLMIFGSDYTPLEVSPDGSRLLLNTEYLAQNRPISLEIGDGYVSWETLQGHQEAMESPYLFALKGQDDLEGDSNYTIFAAFNRVISGTPDRVGFGVTRVTITFLHAESTESERSMCNGLLTPQLVVGESGRVLPGDANNLREMPSTKSTSLGSIPGGETFSVLEGPVCAENIVWWRVNYQGVIGWTGEGQNQNYWAEPVFSVQTPTPDTTPLATPAVTPSLSPDCAGLMPSRLAAGGYGRVLPGDPNNIRQDPSANAEFVAEIPGGEVFSVLDGPVCADSIVWWKVNYQGFTGWTGESQGQTYWVEPDTSRVVPTPTPTPVHCAGLRYVRLQVNGQGRVLPGDPNSLRSEASTSSDKIGVIPAGGIFTVLEGPACVENGAWWRVDYQGLVGWTGEGQDESYWVEPYIPAYAPTLPPPAPPCDGGSQPRLMLGGEGRVLPGEPNNLRSSSSADGELVSQIQPGETFTVIEGPMCSENMTWWKVRYREQYVGWTPEMKGQDYWVEPFGDLPVPGCPNNPLPQLKVGGYGRVAPPNSNVLRSDPTTTSTEIGQIPVRAVFTVVEGPMCSENMTWWKVSYQGLVGWTGESQGMTYWVSPAECKNRALVIGEIALVANVDANFRKAWPQPSEANDPYAQEGFVGYIGGGITVKVLEGPVCTGATDWWKVDNYNGLQGWIPGDLLSYTTTPVIQ